MSPMAISGSWKVDDGSAITVRANAGSSIP